MRLNSLAKHSGDQWRKSAVEELVATFINRHDAALKCRQETGFKAEMLREESIVSGAQVALRTTRIPSIYTYWGKRGGGGQEHEAVNQEKASGA